jgi:zinc D-Ala-D-Ala carboxypeptidase
MSVNIGESGEPTWLFFDREEFACRCGNCENMIQNPLIDKLDKAREISGVSYKINSGYRCLAHNTSIGGSKTSLHMAGRAADIHVSSSAARYQILKGLFAAELDRVLIYKTFIHADIAGEGKQSEIALWMG